MTAQSNLAIICCVIEIIVLCLYCVVLCLNMPILIIIQPWTRITSMLNIIKLFSKTLARVPNLESGLPKIMSCEKVSPTASVYSLGNQRSWRRSARSLFLHAQTDLHWGGLAAEVGALPSCRTSGPHIDRIGSTITMIPLNSTTIRPSSCSRERQTSYRSNISLARPVSNNSTTLSSAKLCISTKWRMRTNTST